MPGLLAGLEGIGMGMGQFAQQRSQQQSQQLQQLLLDRGAPGDVFVAGGALTGHQAASATAAVRAIERSRSRNSIGVARRWRFERRWQTPVLISRARSSRE